MREIPNSHHFERKTKKIGAKCFALGSRTAKAVRKRKTARVESSTASVGDSMHKSAAQKSTENLARKQNPVKYCNHLQMEVDFLKITLSSNACD